MLLQRYQRPRERPATCLTPSTSLSSVARSRSPRMPVSQVPVDWLLQKAESMFPEGQGAPRAFTKDGDPAAKTNELLENASLALCVMLACVSPGSHTARGARRRSRRRGGCLSDPAGGRYLDFDAVNAAAVATEATHAA